MVGLEKGVRDCTGKYSVAVIQLVVGCMISMNVESFNCV